MPEAVESAGTELQRERGTVAHMMSTNGEREHVGNRMDRWCWTEGFPASTSRYSRGMNQILPAVYIGTGPAFVSVISGGKAR